MSRVLQAISRVPAHLPGELAGVVPARTEDWLYADGSFELAVLDRMVTEGFAANSSVHYSRNYGRPAARATFRPPSGMSRISVRVFGDLQTDGCVVEDASDGWWTVSIAADAPDAALTVVSAQPGCPPALAVPKGAGTGWYARAAEDADWIGVMVRPGAGDPPHLQDEPIVNIDCHHDRKSGLWELDSPVLGRPILTATLRPTIVCGESPAEALQDGGETSFELTQRPDGRWTTVHRIGFRYLAVTAGDVTAVSVDANVRPAAAMGEFACSSDRLTRIWSVAAYTLRICSQRLMVDGIKRDRMPWIGDQALNSLAVAYTTGDGELVRDGLSALGRPRGGYVNGIADYSLWWLISRAAATLYFGLDPAGDADRVHAFVSALAEYSTGEGVFRPAPHADDFTGGAGGPVFIDWGVTIDPGRDSTTLQMMWFWALTSAAALLHAAGHPGAAQWHHLAERVRDTLRSQAWDAPSGAWREYLDGGSSASAYPNMMAVLSEIDPTVSAGVRAAIRDGRVGTPFMTGFALRALAVAGDPDAVVDRIERSWGAMLEQGFGTFWEEFPEPGASPYAMYGRPFGKSLCHAWSSGPAAILPEVVLGIRPLAAGWSEVAVDPRLGNLEWASATVPTPLGSIQVRATRASTVVDLPAGVVLVRPDGDRIPGPGRVEWR